MLTATQIITAGVMIVEQAPNITPRVNNGATVVVCIVPTVLFGGRSAMGALGNPEAGEMFGP